MDERDSAAIPDGRRWHALILTLPESRAEEIAAQLAGGRLGVQFEEAGYDTTTVQVFLREPDSVDGAVAEAGEILAGHGLDAASCNLHTAVIEDGRWVERYQASLTPFDLGTRFVVWPSGEGVDDGKRIPLKLVPGRAFGTGEHPTTRGCTEQLETRVVPGSRWLDLGCGTGALSLVAHHCGAGSIVGWDLDPVAVDVARETAAVNGAPDNVAFAVGSATEAPEPGPFDGVVCNIAASFFLSYPGDLAALVGPGGILVASGFLVEDVTPILDGLARHGLREVERIDRSPWAILVAERPA